MSETTATIIKILSSLTSPKASVKYISVGLFMLIAWKNIGKFVESYGIPSEQASLIILFIGLGFGSIIGHLIYMLIDFFWSKYELSKKEALEERAKEVARNAADDAREASDALLLNKFKKVFPHYDYWTRKRLRDLSVEELCLEWGTDDVDVSNKNGYIEKVANVDRDKDIYKLHSALIEFVSTEWKAEVDRNMNDFFDDFSNDKQALIKLLEFANREDNKPIKTSVIEVARFCNVFDIEVENDISFYITVEQPYHDLICQKLKVELSDETYILKERITPELNVA